MLDVDFFKNYNDCYGHQEGDDCLRRVAGLLQSHARRASDLAARYGGEEFVLIAADTDADSALALAETIRAAFEALQLPHERSPLGCVTASIGVVSLVPDESSSAEQHPAAGRPGHVPRQGTGPQPGGRGAQQGRAPEPSCNCAHFGAAA